MSFQIKRGCPNIYDVQIFRVNMVISRLRKLTKEGAGVSLFFFFVFFFGGGGGGLFFLEQVY